MRKAERLFQLLTYLQGRRVAVTGEQISQHLEVSKRTVYRDIAALQQSGIPIDGEAGVGYQLDRRFQMAPIMFDYNELATIRLGMSLIRGSADDELKKAAEQVLNKVAAQLPERGKESFDTSTLVVPKHSLTELQNRTLTNLRKCIRDQYVVCLSYRDEAGNTSERAIEPLGLMCYVRHWTLVAFCHLRQDYRAFRIDRIDQIQLTDQQFETSNNKSLLDYMEREKQSYELTWYY